jgi:hypothetical protein
MVGYPASLAADRSESRRVLSFQVECHSYSFAHVVVRSHGALPREDKPPCVGLPRLLPAALCSAPSLGTAGERLGL